MISSFQAGFMTHRRSLIAAGIIIPVLAASIWMRDADERLATVHIETPNGELVVELADTPTSRSSGLAGRGALGSDGVLLKWTEPARHPIWMKGMRFALDLLWIDADGRVVAALTDVPPCSADPCPLYEPSGSDRSVAVLELPANAAVRHGLAVGASLEIGNISPPR
jgi:uncharacterized membrane protein (UPF0127 family)